MTTATNTTRGRVLIPNEKRSWIVRVERTVVTDVIVDDCTEEEARDEPYRHVIDEIDIEQSDYAVMTVKPNKVKKGKANENNPNNLDHPVPRVRRARMGRNG